MPTPRLNPLEALRGHWPECAIERWALGMFMISASVATVLLCDPRSSAFHLTRCIDCGCQPPAAEQGQAADA